MVKQLCGIGVIVLAVFSCSQNSIETITIINALNNNIDVPVEFIIPDIFEETKVYSAHSPSQEGEEFMLQMTPALFYENEKTSSLSVCAILPSGIKDGKYLLRPIEPEQRFTLEENNKGQLQVFEGDTPVLTYNYGMQLANNVPERYRRSSYVHPLYDLHGNVLTADFPSDHYHHRGISWMWPKIFVNEKRYDIWHIYGPQGEFPGIHHVFEKWLLKETGAVCATIKVKNYWQLETKEQVMDEWITIRMFRETDFGRAIDISMIWKAIVPIELEGQTTKGYGGLNFRFAQRERTELTSSEGKEDDSDLKNLPWADLTAIFNQIGKFSGAAIFQH